MISQQILFSRKQCNQELRRQLLTFYIDLISIATQSSTTLFNCLSNKTVS